MCAGWLGLLKRKQNDNTLLWCTYVHARGSRKNGKETEKAISASADQEEKEMGPWVD